MKFLFLTIIIGIAFSSQAKQDSLGGFLVQCEKNTRLDGFKSEFLLNTESNPMSYNISGIYGLGLARVPGTPRKLRALAVKAKLESSGGAYPRLAKVKTYIAEGLLVIRAEAQTYGGRAPQLQQVELVLKHYKGEEYHGKSIKILNSPFTGQDFGQCIVSSI